jgi:hypothetical protein
MVFKKADTGILQGITGNFREKITALSNISGLAYQQGFFQIGAGNPPQVPNRLPVNLLRVCYHPAILTHWNKYRTLCLCGKAKMERPCLTTRPRLIPVQ